MPTNPTVRKANKASSYQLLSSSNFPVVNDTERTYSIFHSTELDEYQRKNIWNIFETNMRNLYNNSSFGWDPQSKEAELFSPLSRFILVCAEGSIVAFVAFRFECEHHENIIYCYDLQVLSSYQRSGLGRILVLGLENIGSAWGMVKITLTVFKANINARRFYENTGFQIDTSSPGYLPNGGATETQDSGVDYEILSKHL